MLTTEQRLALSLTSARVGEESAADSRKFVEEYARTIRALNRLKEEKEAII